MTHRVNNTSQLLNDFLAHQQVLSGTGDGTTDSPFTQEFKSDSMQSVLCDIVAELKKMNMHLHILTETHIEDTEVN